MCSVQVTPCQSATVWVWLDSSLHDYIWLDIYFPWLRGPVVIWQNALTLLEKLSTKLRIPKELQTRVCRMDVIKASDADMAGQGYSHLTATQLTTDDTFMLKSVSGSIPAAVLIQGIMARCVNMEWNLLLNRNRDCQQFTSLAFRALFYWQMFWHWLPYSAVNLWGFWSEKGQEWTTDLLFNHNIS